MTDRESPDNPYLYLTTRGWRSGQAHEIEIWYVARDGRYYLLSEKRERAHWVQNLLREPSVTFRVAGVRYNGTARTIRADDEPELAAAVSGLMENKYGWSNGLIVELTPHERIPSVR